MVASPPVTAIVSKKSVIKWIKIHFLLILYNVYHPQIFHIFKHLFFRPNEDPICSISLLSSIQDSVELWHLNSFVDYSLLKEVAHANSGGYDCLSCDISDL